VSTITDASSRYTYVKLLNEISAKEVVSHIQAVATEAGHRIRTLLSDNGSEYENKLVEAVVTKLGIHYIRTDKYSIHQNGIAERKNRTLFESSLSSVT
jgi:transposase InsO family protein